MISGYYALMLAKDDQKKEKLETLKKELNNMNNLIDGRCITGKNTELIDCFIVKFVLFRYVTSNYQIETLT